MCKSQLFRWVVLVLTLASAGARADGIDLGEVVGNLVAADASGFVTVDSSQAPRLVAYRYDRDGVLQGTKVLTEAGPPGKPLLRSVQGVGDLIVAHYSIVSYEVVPEVETALGVWTLAGEPVFFGVLPDKPPGARGPAFSGENGAVYVVRTSLFCNDCPFVVDQISVATKQATRLLTATLPNTVNLIPGGGQVLRQDGTTGLSRLSASGAVLQTMNFADLRAVPNTAFLGNPVLRADPSRAREIDILGTGNGRGDLVTLDRATLTVLRRAPATVTDDGAMSVVAFSTELTFLGGRLVAVGDTRSSRSIRHNFIVNVMGSGYQHTRAANFSGTVWGGNDTLYVWRKDCVPDAMNCTAFTAQSIERIDLNALPNPSLVLTSRDGAIARLHSAVFVGATILVPGARIEATQTPEGGYVIPYRFENTSGTPAQTSASLGAGWTTNVTQSRFELSPTASLDASNWSLLFPNLRDQRGQTQTYFLQVSRGAAALKTITIVEFFNAQLGHYFMTPEGGEAQGIDTGAAGPGWVRTGQTFAAWPDHAQAPSTAVGVCRFYGNPAIGANGRRVGPNSHFYTADPEECDAVARDPGWLLETREAFFVRRPILQSDVWTCASPASNNDIPVIRYYNNGYPTRDSNHRFVQESTPTAALAEWINEGVRFCVPRQ